MNLALDELAGPPARREVYMRALPLLRIAAVEDVEIDSIFGDQGETVAIAAACHLSHPLLSAVDFTTHFRQLREGVAKFTAFHDGTLDEDHWTADEVAGEVLSPLAWLLHGVEGCRACFATAYTASMLRPRLNGEVSCCVCVVRWCQPCLVASNVLRTADLVAGGHGFCNAHADSAPSPIWPAQLTSIRGGRAS